MMFHLIDPKVEDLASCVDSLADLAELLAPVINGPDFGIDGAHRDGAYYLATSIADGIRNLTQLARGQRATFYLIHPSIRDHANCALVLSEIAEFLTMAIGSRDFDGASSQGRGATHLSDCIADGIRSLAEMAREERDLARAEGYEAGVASARERVPAPDLTEPAPANRRQRRAG